MDDKLLQEIHLIQRVRETERERERKKEAYLFLASEAYLTNEP